MAKTTKDLEKTLEKNLEYIGLDLNKIPTFLKKVESLNFRPSKSYDDTVYKVYRYVNIKDIVIFGFIGIVVASMYVLIVNMLDTTIKSSEDIEKITGVTVLASIPIYETIDEKPKSKRRRRRGGAR